MEYWIQSHNREIWIPQAGNEWQACMLALYDLLTQYPDENPAKQFVVKQHNKKDRYIDLSVVVNLCILNGQYLEDKANAEN